MRRDQIQGVAAVIRRQCPRLGMVTCHVAATEVYQWLKDSDELVIRQRPRWKRALLVPLTFARHYRRFRGYGLGRRESTVTAVRLAASLLREPVP